MPSQNTRILVLIRLGIIQMIYLYFDKPSPAVLIPDYLPVTWNTFPHKRSLSISFCSVVYVKSRPLIMYHFFPGSSIVSLRDGKQFEHAVYGKLIIEHQASENFTTPRVFSEAI